MKIEIDNCYNCDCLDLMQAMKEQGLKADWCITDPPYGIGRDKQKNQYAKIRSIIAKNI